MNDETEEILYDDQDPSPAQVGRVLGCSHQHVKDLCRELGLPLRDITGPTARQPRWRVPLETFRRLRQHIERKASQRGADVCTQVPQPAETATTATGAEKPREAP